MKITLLCTTTSKKNCAMCAITISPREEKYLFFFASYYFIRTVNLRKRIFHIFDHEYNSWMLYFMPYLMKAAKNLIIGGFVNNKKVPS